MTVRIDWVIRSKEKIYQIGIIKSVFCQYFNFLVDNMKIAYSHTLDDN